MKTTKKLLSVIMAVVMMLSLCACGGGTTPPTEPITDPDVIQMPEGSTFSIEFFDVGNADAALVECDGKYMLIDGGNKADSQKMFAILKEKGIGHLEYVVATNTSVEHIGGLAGALNYATAGTTFCPMASENTDAFNDFKKYADKNGGGITVPKAGNKYKLGNAEIEFLAVNNTPDIDNSLIVKVTYGNTSVIFAGNHHLIAEQMAVNGNADLKATVLKVSDCGSDNVTSSEFFREVQPEYAVISTSGKDNCPGKTTVSILEVSATQTYRTDLHGNIICTSDGNTVIFTAEKTADEKNIFVPGEETKKPAETAKPEPTSKPISTPEPITPPKPITPTKPIAVPSPTPEKVQKLESPASADELYEANLMTRLVQVYGSVKRVSHYMGATHVMGSYLVDDKLAYLNSHIYPGGVCSYNGWYNGYSFNDYGLRPAITAYVENLEGDSISPNQTDLAYLFLHEEDIEYLGKKGEDFLFKVKKESFDYTVTVDSQSFAVKKLEYVNGDEIETEEYIFGEWIEGQDILDAWQNGTGMKVVTVYADIYEGSEHKSYVMPIYLPEFWELEISSYTHNIGVYMDSNYTQYYQYPGDGISYDLYVTNAVG